MSPIFLLAALVKVEEDKKAGRRGRRGKTDREEEREDERVCVFVGEKKTNKHNFFPPSSLSPMERFLCPWPGCKRSFAELWRLKVHCRAPSDIRGSGRERGHNEELKHCPRCQADLQPGRHHVGCSAGPVAPRQAAKRLLVRPSFCKLRQRGLV